MKPCERVDALLSDYLERATSPAETRFVERHLAVCPRCRAQRDEMERLLERLAGLPRVEAAPDFTERVLARTHHLPPASLEEPLVPKPRSAARAWAVPLAAAAAVAVVTFGVLRFSSSPPTAPQVAGSGQVTEAAPQRDALAAAARERVGRLRRETPVQQRNLAPVTTLAEVRPDLASGEKTAAQPLGMVHDAYALDDWVLSRPAEGGAPVLTRVRADSSAPVMVTF